LNDLLTKRATNNAVFLRGCANEEIRRYFLKTMITGVCGGATMPTAAVTHIRRSVSTPRVALILVTGSRTD